MELILLENIKKLGTIGDLVKVKKGYARNFLIPFNKAIRATNQNKARIEELKSEILKKDQQNLKNVLNTIEKVRDLTLPIIRQASEDGKLYGSVSARDIANILKSIDSNIEKEHVLLEEPIKYLGEYQIKISLHSQAEAQCVVQVMRNEKAE